LNETLAEKMQPKKDLILKRVYVLDTMFVTPPTSQVERSPLKSPAYANTAAPHSSNKKRKVQ
jgi:hypothetical protein